MKIAFVGIGHVGFALADRLARLRHEVVIAARDLESTSVKDARRKNPSLGCLPLPEAVRQASVVFLATPFHATPPVLKDLTGAMEGKILIDCTNPVGPGLTHGLESKESGGEFVQRLAPGAFVVKAFTIYGFENFENPHFPGYSRLKPAMLIAGNDAKAKAVVADLCTQMGWEPVDTGDISMSLHLEHMTLLWIKMARVQGRGPYFVWGRMTREVPR